MAPLTEQERKDILRENYTPPVPNVEEQRSLFGQLIDFLRALFGMRKSA